ncbi:MAG: hypothetical protein JNL82_04270 [Myxococcales bacterium]|nr:hypothetical protein [Myxococcales bacterium]
MIRPTAVTLALALAAGGAVLLVRHDPWRSGPAAVPLVSNQSAARRVFPELAEDALPRATIRLSAGGRALTIAPGPDGRHRVHRSDELLGWVDGDALDGLWSSLRMATTLRAVAAGSELGPESGAIEVEVDGRRQAVRVHGVTADGVGLYGVLAGEGDEAWVVEPELAELLRQAPEAWVARRLLPQEPAGVAAFTWDGLAVARGEDGLWRVTAGGPRHLLSDGAVDLRLGRLLAADLAPLLARADAGAHGPYTRRLAVTDMSGRVSEVLSGGTCPERPDRLVVDRGEGLLGCVEADALVPWSMADLDAGVIESRLVPHAYGRVLAVDQQAPAKRRLRRFGGGWVIEEGDGLVEVAEPEVYRWFAALQAAEVEPLPVDVAAEPPTAHTLVIETDSGQQLRLACGPGPAGASVCARDDAPALRVHGELPELAFTRDTFADRRLLRFGAGDVRALEILPGDPRGGSVRQSVRLDLGVWRLDAPAHPDGAGVLDEVRLEAMLAALQSARAEAWVATPAVAPQRTLRVERSPTGDPAADTLELALHADCLAHVPGQRRAARLAASTCAALADDLLYDDPLRAWLGQARSVEITDLVPAAPRHLTLRREDGGAFVEVDGEPALARHVARWQAFRSAGIRRGEPRGQASLAARISRTNASVVRLELGPVIDEVPAWVRLAGADWYYLAGPPAAPEPGE